MTDNVRKGYFAVYDYGMGGVWAFIFAHSPEQITQKYPLQTVVTTRPEWMDDKTHQNILSKSFDIDDIPPYWFASGTKDK